MNNDHRKQWHVFKCLSESKNFIYNLTYTSIVLDQKTSKTSTYKMSNNIYIFSFSVFVFSHSGIEIIPYYFGFD